MNGLTIKLGIKYMKIFLIVLVLIGNLQSWTKADDIREFEIEGISVGDSLLNFFSQKEIESFSKQFYPSSDEYEGVEISNRKSKINFSTYDSITVNWKKNDEKFEIVAVSGIKLFPNNLTTCLKERDKIALEIKNMLKSSKEERYEMNYGELYDSVSYAIDLKIDTGSIRIWCTDWDEKTESQNNWDDDLNVSIDTNEFIFWLDNVAYK